jgi:diguanylate cyclase (GGDEF)-like protein
LTEVTTDPLTGLSNLRYLHANGDEALTNAERLGTTARLYVIDLDGFKAVNDRFGHQQGNIVLKEVATALSRLVGPRGMCVRFGGDEFVALVSGHTPVATARFVHSLHVAVEAIICGDGVNRARLGASIGSAEFPHDGRTIEALLTAADARMYRNKADRQRARASIALERIPA